MPTPRTDDETTDENEVSAKKRKPKKETEPSPTWEGMQIRTVSEQLRAALARKGKGWGPTRVGRLAGYADHSQTSRYFKGGSGVDDHGMVRIANALGCEICVVPKDTPEALSAKAAELDARELRVILRLIELLVDFHDDSRIVEHLEKEVPWLRDRGLRARSFDAGS